VGQQNQNLPSVKTNEILAKFKELEDAKKRRESVEREEKEKEALIEDEEVEVEEKAEEGEGEDGDELDDMQTNHTQLSSKSYISKLQHDLNAEK
jgi:hypothetical protein